jgi:hypothetical protein
MPTPAPLSVHQPQPLEAVTAALNPTPADPNFNYYIVASGKVRGSQKKLTSLVACLVDQSTNVPCKSKVLKVGMHWAIMFFIPPPGALDPQGNPTTKYHLFVGHGQTETDGHPGVSVEFFVVPQPAAMPMVGGTIPVSYPGQNANLCPPFTAYGSNGPNGPATSGTIVGTNSFAGSVVAGMPSGTWAITFGSLPDDDYTLGVSNAGGDGGSVGGLTVDSSQCCGHGRNGKN